MDKPISVGDLVAVVRATPCCGVYDPKHPVFVVTGFLIGNFTCHFCNTERPAVAVEMADPRWVCDVDRIKRIPPPEELNIVKEDEEITA